MELTSTAKQRMEKFMRDNVQHAHGRHRYSLEEYGACKEEILLEFRFYYEYMETLGFSNE